MKKSWFGIGLAVAFGAVDCFAAAPVFDTEDGKYIYEFPYYVIDTPADASNTLASAAFTITKYESAEDAGATISYADLLEADSGTIVKTGAGTLEIAAALSNWEGRIHVMAGILYSHGIGTLGKNLSTGKTARALESDATFVHSGATIYRKPTSGGATMENGDRKMIVIEGHGVDGRGALVADSPNSNETTWPLGFDLVLTGDATIRNARNGWALKTSWSPDPGQKFTLNGHTLTILGDAPDTGSAFNHNHTPVTAGHIVASNMEYRLYGNGGRLNYMGGASNTLTLTGGSYLDFNGGFKGNNTHWTLVADDVKFVQPTGTDRVYDGVVYQTWIGPVNLVRDLPLYCGFNNTFGTVGFAGYVYGPGGFPMRTGQRNLDFHLSCPSNAFKGSVVINRGLVTLHNPGALPVDCAGLTVTNGTLAMQYIANARYRLPAAEFSGTGLVVGVERNMINGQFASLRKTGEGSLDNHTLVGADVLELEGGTYRMAQTAHEMAAGLIFGASGNHTSASTPVFSNYIGSPFGSIAYTNSVELSLHKAYQESSLAKSNAYTYVGYIWNNNATNENWTFAYGMNQSMTICINGTKFNGYTSFWADKIMLFKTVEVHPGANLFDVRMYGSQSSGGGAIKGNVFTNCVWKDNFGVAVDRLGRGSTNHEDYVAIEDPGDGSVLTVVADPDAEIGGAQPVIGTVRAKPGTTFVINGLPLSIDNLEGVTAISNCPAFTVTDGWTVDAAVIGGGGILTCDGELAFGDAATLAVTESRHVRSSPIGGWTLAEAEGGISLPEGWQSRVSLPNGKYRLSLSGDGKRLMLEHLNGTVFAVR